MTIYIEKDLTKITRTGYWFCKSCQEITDVKKDKQGKKTCLFCDSAKVSWHKPIMEP